MNIKIYININIAIITICKKEILSFFRLSLYIYNANIIIPEDKSVIITTLLRRNALTSLKHIFIANAKIALDKNTNTIPIRRYFVSTKKMLKGF